MNRTTLILLPFAAAIAATAAPTGCTSQTNSPPFAGGPPLPIFKNTHPFLPVEKQMNQACPPMDHAISVLLEDLAQRGLSDRVLLVITGEFGRTPRINQFGGRDHWGPLCTLALAGGGLKMGQVIGESSSKAELPKSTPIAPKDLMATIFHVLGIDSSIQYPDQFGRPQYLLPDGGRPIAELI